MNRDALDTFAQDYQLSHAAIEAALNLTGNRPTVTAWRDFAQRLLRAAGIGAIGAGIIFFVAANWQDYGVMGRFVLLQTALLLSVGVALWHPPPHVAGQSALILATLLTGTLLALFGQSYQTGADVYELFFFWALLALPFALAAFSGAVWAIWWVVLNLALGLYFGFLGPDHSWLTLAGLSKAAGVMVLCVINLIAAIVYFMVRKTVRFSAAAPLWLIRALEVLGAFYGTVACIQAIDEFRRNSDARMQSIFVLLMFGVICALIARKTLEHKQDVFTMALIAASAIVVSTTALAERISFSHIGSFFMVALWLIVTSTGTSMLLMHWVRTWRVESGETQKTSVTQIAP